MYMEDLSLSAIDRMLLSLSSFSRKHVTLKVKCTESTHDVTSEPQTLSLLSTVWPLRIGMHIPRLPSLRRSFSSYNLQGSKPHSPMSSGDTSRPATPPPDYQSARTSFSGERRSSEEDTLFGWSSRPSACPPVISIPRSVRSDAADEDGSRTGLALLQHSVSESACQTVDASFSRQLYIHSLTYLLRGLPAHLSTEEQLNLHTAIPQSLAQPTWTSEDGQLIISPRSAPLPTAAEQAQEQARQNRTLLQKITASIILRLFLLTAFLWPHIQLLLRGAYAYERDHRVVERLFATSLSTADELGKRTVAAAALVAGLNDGKVGHFAARCGRSVVEGVYEGVGEGMGVWGIRAERVEGRAEGRRRGRV
ncbi:hypothetical protein LTR66_005257 [Elasticomyces elasticus]|nr:hypothetical protein LTR66_005257 [Elasticomyces elasticus]